MLSNTHNSTNQLAFSVYNYHLTFIILKQREYDYKMDKKPVDINLVTNKWKNYKKAKGPNAPVSVGKTKPSPLKRKDTSLQVDKKVRKKENTGAAGKGNWKKVFAFSKFISLAKAQSEQEPANLIVGGRYNILL